MTEPKNGFEFLKQLRENNGKQIQNFRALSHFLDSKAREKGVPINGQFELTPLCNFSCKMCYVHLNADQLNGRSVMTVSAWKNLMHQAWEAGMLHATLTGGECLAYPGFEELYLYLKELGCEVNILTNGYLLDEERIRFFTEHKPAILQITLYGWNDDVYERVTGRRAFRTVIENTRKAMEAGLPVTLNVTPNRYLGEDIFETIRLGHSLCKSFTVNSSVFDPREETGRSGQQDDPETEQYIQIYRLLNELNGREIREIDEDKLPPAGGPDHECAESGLRCGGGRSSFVMTWEGVMMPCNRMNMIRADAVKEGISKAWSIINQGVKTWPRVPECDGCPYNSVCNKCTAYLLRFAEPGKLPKELCERTKSFVRRGVCQIPECE